MSGGVQHFARRWWAGRYGTAGRLLGLVAIPLSWLWRAATAFRFLGTGRGGARVEGLSVVSIGNLAVGGTGKTPIASWVAREIAGTGAAPALVLSGYGPDEERLHMRWTPELPVFSGRDRVAAAERARREGADVAVLDDGFQHRKLARDVDIVLLAVEDPIPMWTLPRGPYREPVAALDRADAIVLTRRGTTTEADAVRFRERVSRTRPVVNDRIIACVRLAPGRLEPLAGSGAIESESVGETLGLVHVVTGIARPDDFVDDVTAVAGAVSGVSLFADHHPFSQADAVRIRAGAGTSAIVMTEKDAVKLRSYARELPDAWVLCQRLRWDWGEEELRALVRSGAARDGAFPGEGR